MENIQRDMGRNINLNNIPEHKIKKKKWTVLFVGSQGKTFIIKRFKIFFFFFLFLLITSLLSSLFLFFLYKNKTDDLKKAKIDLAVMKEHTVKLNTEKDMFLAMSVIKKSSEALDLGAKEFEDKNKTLITSNNYNKIRKNNALKKEKTDIVEVDDFNVVFNKKSGEVDIRFNVTKNNNETGTISGYVFIILKNNEDIKKWKIIPNVFIKDGKPNQFFRGKPFFIKRFKKMEFNASIEEVIYNVFKTALILIYDKNGNLIFKKDFDIL
jgi:hypothetical protein